MPRPHPIDLRWKALLSDFRRSGLTQAEFCRRRNISLASFRYHFYKPRPANHASVVDRSPASSDNHFLPVSILADPTPIATSSQPHLELVLSNGRRISVTPGFDPQTLRRLIAVVEERPCSD
jgi:transposase